MKNKLSFLLLIAGGVLAALRLSAFAALPAPAVAVAGGFLLGFSYLLFNSVYAGTVWGVRIKSSGAGSFKQIFGAVGLVIGGFSLVHTGLELFVSLFAGEIVYCLVLLLCRTVGRRSFAREGLFGKDACARPQRAGFGELSAFSGAGCRARAGGVFCRQL